MHFSHKLRETTEKLFELMKQEVADELNRTDTERLASFFRKSVEVLRRDGLLVRNTFLTIECRPANLPKGFDLLSWVILQKDSSKVTISLQKGVFDYLELFTLEWRPIIFVYEKGILLSLDRISETCTVESGKEGAGLEFGKPVKFNIKPFIEEVHNFYVYGVNNSALKGLSFPLTARSYE